MAVVGEARAITLDMGNSEAAMAFNKVIIHTRAGSVDKSIQEEAEASISNTEIVMLRNSSILPTNIRQRFQAPTAQHKFPSTHTSTQPSRRL